MSVKMRQEVERKIVTAVVNAALGAGCSVTVNDGEEDVLKKSTDKKEILKAMFTTDEDIIFTHAGPRNLTGWVRFIYGNDGYDVVSDYTTNLEPLMVEANKISEHYSD